jgi:hypothetical protein
MTIRTVMLTMLAVVLPAAASPLLPPRSLAIFAARDDRVVRADDAPRRVAVFRASGFPTTDFPSIPAPVLDVALAGLPADTLGSVRELKERLNLHNRDVLVLPYGSSFPLDAWIELRDFLRAGGGLVVLGGAPFHQPVLQAESGAWHLGVRQQSFARELLIGPAERVEVASSWKTSIAEPSWSIPVEGSRTVWELTVRLGTRPEFPAESGSEAPRDGVLRPLVHLADAAGIPRACPLLEIDRLRGDNAGARWVFATSDAPLSSKLIRALIGRAMQGAAAVEARPVYASIANDEVPRIRVAVNRTGNADATRARRAELVVRDSTGGEIDRGVFDLNVSAVTEIQMKRPAAPGLYHVTVTVQDAQWEPRSATTGFWVRDATLLGAGPHMTVSRDWLRRNGQVFPVIGTTYMASDVHRQFLFEPNPHIWDRDFAVMARLGINFVRTGLWTGWGRASDDRGLPDEAMLRALEAYVQTAAKHGIIVNFTFFAFLPQSFGGSNPYLDPRSIEGESAFLSAIARRFRDVGWIHYDLINEPSYAPANGLWSNRPIGDEWERRAWQEWVRRRHGANATALRDLWQDASADPFELPRQDELSYAQIRENRRPRKVRDFVVFSQDAVTGWARRMRDVLRSAGGDVLVTLGQDEGGTWLRSSQQLHADAVDYTAVHPWWQNDDVLSTGVFAKVPEKPALFQETGLMRLEDVDGMPWRSPALAAAVLERKYASAFAARNCGVVEWAWNINPYMPIDNESAIGFFRPDGTAKPEIDVAAEFAKFFHAAATWLDDFDPDPVVIVVPHSRLFMGRPAATDGFRRIIRVLAERFGVVPTALSELRLTAQRLRHARLVIVPSPEFLEEEAAVALLAASKEGARVLVTGAVSGDPYGRVGPALGELRITDAGAPVTFREATNWGRSGFATFDRNLQESLPRSTAPPLENLTGNIWHEPLPLEHAHEDEPLSALLAGALAASGIETHPSDRGGVSLRVLTGSRALLVVAINETSRDAERRVTLAGRAFDIRVPAGRSRMILLDRSTGNVIAQTGEAPRGPHTLSSAGDWE